MFNLIEFCSFNFNLSTYIYIINEIQRFEKKNHIIPEGECKPIRQCTVLLIFYRNILLNQSS